MRRAGLLLLLALAALGLAACGGSGGEDGTQLVKQTFGNAQKVRSGKVSVVLNVDTQGGSSIKGPIQLRFGGPFERPAKGAPHYAFSLSASAQGQTISAGATSTGQQGFVTVQGTNYVLPAAQYAKLNQSYEQVSGIAQPKTTGSGNIPWVKNPKVVGDETIAGAETTHVKGDVDVATLVNGLEQRQGATSRLSDQQRQQIIDAVKDPTFDFWTGKDDKVLRRVKIGFRIDVPEADQSRLGGVHAVNVTLDNTLSDLNERQTITALPNPHPLSQLTAQIQGLLGELGQLQGGLGGGLGGLGSGGGSGGSGGGSGTGTGGATGAQAQKYAQCLAKAGSDIAAAQKCASLLGK